MLVGHINLDPSTNDTADSVSALVEALQRNGLQQYALVRSAALAARLAALDDVGIGPLVQSPVMANCLLPRVDIVHVHEPTAGLAGLLLTLTRSIPYVLTHRGTVRLTGKPLVQAVYRRAAVVICEDDCEVAILRHGLPELRVEVIPDLGVGSSANALLRLYQNSQSTPIAGNKGIQ